MSPELEVGLIAFVAFLALALFGYGLYRLGAWWVDRRAEKAMDDLTGKLMTPPEDCADVCTERKGSRLKALR